MYKRSEIERPVFKGDMQEGFYDRTVHRKKIISCKEKPKSQELFVFSCTSSPSPVLFPVGNDRKSIRVVPVAADIRVSSGHSCRRSVVL